MEPRCLRPPVIEVLSHKSDIVVVFDLEVHKFISIHLVKFSFFSIMKYMVKNVEISIKHQIRLAMGLKPIRRHLHWHSNCCSVGYTVYSVLALWRQYVAHYSAVALRSFESIPIAV